MELIPVGTECQDEKHGARVRICGYRMTQKSPQEGSTMATGASGGTVCEVTLLEDATRFTFINGQQLMFEKGAVVQTPLNMLEPVK